MFAALDEITGGHFSMCLPIFSRARLDIVNLHLFSANLGRMRAFLRDSPVFKISVVNS